MVYLDVFRKFPYPKVKNEQTAWLSFLLTESIEDAESLMEEYPWLEEVYQELAMLRQRPEEVLGMFSDALKILDRNTVKYMIEEQQQVMKQQQKVLDDQRRTLEEQKRSLLEKDQRLQEKDQTIQEKEAEIQALKAMLETSGKK